MIVLFTNFIKVKWVFHSLLWIIMRILDRVGLFEPYFIKVFIPKYPLTQLHLRTEKYLRKNKLILHIFRHCSIIMIIAKTIKDENNFKKYFYSII